MLFSSRDYNYPDDIFDDTRMSFGDHLEELRSRLIKALVGLTFFLVIGFVLDGLGDWVGNPNIGIGRPMMRVIVEPVESQARNFYHNRAVRSEAKLPAGQSNPEEVARVRAKLEDAKGDVSALSSDEKRILLGASRERPVVTPVAPLARCSVSRKTR